MSMASSRERPGTSFVMRSRAHDPVGITVGKVLLLPDRNVVLEALDPVTGRLERLGAVGRRDAHDHGDLADAERSEPVPQRSSADGPPFEQLPPDLLEGGGCAV